MNKTIKEQESFFKYMTDHTVTILGKNYMRVEDVVSMIPKYFVEREVGISILAAIDTIPKAKEANADDPVMLQSFEYLNQILELIVSDSRGRMLFDILEQALHVSREKAVKEDGIED